jgi:signal transduction histidine kinase
VDVVGPADRLPVGGDAEEQLYRLIQEALYNVVKHARTAAASVVIASDSGETSVTVRDEGVGFDPDVGHPGHVGLASMRERVARLGGRLTLASAPGAGTTVTVSIPFVDPDASAVPE